MAPLQELRDCLCAFIGLDGNKVLAGRIEVGLDRLFPGDERFVDLVDALASYQPGGGDLLFSYERIVPLCRAALNLIEEDQPASSDGAPDGGRKGARGSREEPPG